MKLNQRELSELLETAIVAARLAGQHAMEEINYVKTSIKNDSELVTQADAQCQKIIIDQVKQKYPDHGFIGEEGEAGNIYKLAPRGDRHIWWIIDPIDGTNNFSRRMLLFAVSIGIMLDGEPIAGVIFDPATESMFTGIKDGLAQLNGKHIFTGESIIDNYSSIGLDSYYDNGVPAWTCELMRRSKFRNFGTTALQLAYVASGGLIGTIVSMPKLWDIAAGTVIAEAAGAVSTNFHGQPIFPLDLDSYEGQQIPTVTANPKAHPQIIELINS